MSNRTDSNVYTILFAIAMVIVVGSLLAFAASSLEPTISENKRLEKQQNILYAMGVNNNDESSAVFVSTDKAPQLFTDNVSEQIVLEVKDGKITSQMTRQEYMDANNGQEPYLIDIKKQKSNAKSGEARKMPLFVGKNKEGKTVYVAPIYGKGLWDAIWGYVAVDENMVVQGAYFDHKGETPGLGANIKQRYFMDDFAGESILDGTRYAGIKVAKGNNDPVNLIKDDNEVDALAGATNTWNWLSAMIRESVHLYKDYLETIRAQ